MENILESAETIGLSFDPVLPVARIFRLHSHGNFRHESRVVCEIVRRREVGITTIVSRAGSACFNREGLITKMSRTRRTAGCFHLAATRAHAGQPFPLERSAMNFPESLPEPARAPREWPVA